MNVYKKTINFFYKNSKRTVTHTIPNHYMSDYIELRSDVKTLPTKKMRESIIDCVVGDDSAEEDSTMKELESKLCKMFNKERALIVPSGFMGNMLSLLINSERGSYIAQGHLSHINKTEFRSQNIFGFEKLLIENNPDATFNLNENKLKEIQEKIKKISVFSLENTHNFTGGRVLPLSYPTQLRSFLKEKFPMEDFKFHLDGSRIWNASVSSNAPLHELVKEFSTVNVCFSKGLGCPIGSAVLLNDSDYSKAKEIRQTIGGQLRQTGILASFALVGLEDWIERMKKDHNHAKMIAEGIHKIPGLIVLPPELTQSNIVIIDLEEKHKDKMDIIVNELNERFKIKIYHLKNVGVLRCVTHHQVTTDQIEYTIEKMRIVFNEQLGN